jgi:hypothetical protein
MANVGINIFLLSFIVKAVMNAPRVCKLRKTDTAG